MAILFMYLVIVLYNKLICLYAYKCLHWDTLYVVIVWMLLVLKVIEGLSGKRGEAPFGKLSDLLVSIE